MSEGPKLEKIPDFITEPIHFYIDDSKKNKQKTSFSDESKQKRRKSAFNKHPREYSDVYDINLINEESIGKNINDQIKKQLLGLNKKNSFLESMSPLDNQFGNEKEKLHNQLNQILQAQVNIQLREEKERKLYEEKKNILQTLIEETKNEQFEELQALSLEKKKKMIELETLLQYKKKDKLKEKKEYYDELNKALSLKNLLIKEIKEMIDIAQKIPTLTEKDEYNWPIELVKNNYMMDNKSIDDSAEEKLNITEIKKTRVMPMGLNETKSILSDTIEKLQLNLTQKQFFDLHYTNTQEILDKNKRQENSIENNEKQTVYKNNSRLNSYLIQEKNKKEEKNKDFVLIRDIYNNDF